MAKKTSHRLKVEHTSITLVNLVEKSVEVEDKERNVKEAEHAIAIASRRAEQQIQAGFLQVEASKRHILSEEVRLNEERRAIENDKTALAMERHMLAQEREKTAAAAAATTMLVAVDVEQTRKEEVAISLKEAEDLDMKVRAAKHEYQTFVSTGMLDDDDDDDDATSNQHEAIVMYKRSITTSSTRTTASASKSMIARSPKNRKMMEMKAKQLAKRAKTTREKVLAIEILEKISSDAAEREEE